MKLRYYILFIALWYMAGNMKAQVTIGMDRTPNLAALLDLVQNNDNTSSMGLLLPRLTLNSVSTATPLSRHVPAMLVYNKNTVSGLNKDVYINNGTTWHPLGYLPLPARSGQYLALDNNLNLSWTDITVPTPTQGVFTLMNSTSYNNRQMYQIQNDQSPWMKFGDTIKVIPRHAENRLVITIQALLNKEYDASRKSGWISYSAGIFLDHMNGLMLDSRTGTLVYQEFNENVRTYSLVTLHFVVENLSGGQQNILPAFRRNDSQNFNSILYIGYDRVGDVDDQNPNLFNTASSISIQYYEDKSSPFI